MTKEAIRYVKDGLSRQKLFNALECIELLEKENEKLEHQVSYLEDNLRVARKEREELRDDVANGLEEFIKKKPHTSLRLIANKEVKEENEQLKQKIKNIGDFIQTGDLCSICKFENKCNPNECYSQNVRVYKKWELADENN